MFNFFPKKVVCVEINIIDNADIQANALIPMTGLVVTFVAKLSADLGLLLSSIFLSVKPAVLTS